jgi:hypothetical protein
MEEQSSLPHSCCRDGDSLHPRGLAGARAGLLVVTYVALRHAHVGTHYLSRQSDGAALSPSCCPPYKPPEKSMPSCL